MSTPRRWLCSCPDHSERLHKLSSLSETWANPVRNWQGSKAGAKGDCKHIMSGKLTKGVPQPVYTDEPVEKRRMSAPTYRPTSTSPRSFTFGSFRGFKK